MKKPNQLDQTMSAVSAEPRQPNRALLITSGVALALWFVVLLLTSLRAM